MASSNRSLARWSVTGHQRQIGALSKEQPTMIKRIVAAFVLIIALHGVAQPATAVNWSKAPAQVADVNWSSRPPLA